MQIPLYNGPDIHYNLFRLDTVQTAGLVLNSGLYWIPCGGHKFGLWTHSIFVVFVCHSNTPAHSDASHFVPMSVGNIPDKTQHTTPHQVQCLWNKQLRCINYIYLYKSSADCCTTHLYINLERPLWFPSIITPSAQRNTNWFPRLCSRSGSWGM